MLEALIAAGHSYPALLNYSPALLRLFYRKAQARLIRDDAAADLRFLRLTKLAVVASIDSAAASAFRDTVSELERLSSGEQPAGGNGQLETIQRLAAVHKAMTNRRK